MKTIKKVDVTPIIENTGKIIDSFNTSDDKHINAPSLNAVQEYVKNTYSSNEIKTNEIWIDGKPIYKKTVAINSPDIGTNSAGIGNDINRSWVDLGNSYYEFVGIDGTTSIIPIIFVSGDAQARAYTTINVVHFGRTAWPAGVAYITIKYTKTTD